MLLEDEEANVAAEEGATCQEWLVGGEFGDRGDS
jgi:hypothetical protein